MDAAGEVITVGLFEELSPGVRLIGVNNREAVFEKNGESLLVINFKNQIILISILLTILSNIFHDIFFISS